MLFTAVPTAFRNIHHLALSRLGPLGEAELRDSKAMIVNDRTD
jgi:hypothetical protein